MSFPLFHCGLYFWLNFKYCTILFYLNSKTHSREICARISFYLFHFACDRFIVCICQAPYHPLNNMNIQELSAAAASLIFFLKNSNTHNDSGITFVCSGFAWDVHWYYYLGNFLAKTDKHSWLPWKSISPEGENTHQAKDFSV